MEKEFTEFSKSDKLLKQELGSVQRSCLSHVSCWCCGNILLSYTRGGWMASSTPFNVMTNIFVIEFIDSVKTFRENSIKTIDEMLLRGW